MKVEVITMEGKLAIGESMIPMRKRPDLSRWVKPYTIGVSAIGVSIAVLAVINLPADLPGLLLFAAMACIAELLSVQLFESSRLSRVSVSSIIAITSILVFGPLGGALTHFASAAMTVISTSIYSGQQIEGRASIYRRAAFNMGMYVTSAFAAGFVYVLLKGSLWDKFHFFNLVPLLGASIADTMTNIILLIGVITLQTGRSPLVIWRQNFQWAAPISVLGGVLGGGALAIVFAHFGLLGLLVFFLPVLSISYSFRLYVNHTKHYVNQLEESNRAKEVANQELAKANQNLETNNRELMVTLGKVIDAFDVYTSGHHQLVAKISQALAEKLGLSHQELERLQKAALLHDVGKVGVPEGIIGKTGKLTDDEYNQIKRHPIIGAEIVGQISGFQDVVPMILYHHERWDGKGYPYGLVGNEIPIEARILALADSVAVMCSDRPYRPTKSFREIKEEIERCSGTQFDPQVVQSFFLLVNEKGSEFFKNSAILVDEEIGNNQHSVRFLKRSMVKQ